MSSQAHGRPLLLQAAECTTGQGSLTPPGVTCRFSSLNLVSGGFTLGLEPLKYFFSRLSMHRLNIPWQWGGGLDFFVEMDFGKSRCLLQF